MFFLNFIKIFIVSISIFLHIIHKIYILRNQHDLDNIKEKYIQIKGNIG